MGAIERVGRRVEPDLCGYTARPKPRPSRGLREATLWRSSDKGESTRLSADDYAVDHYADAMRGVLEGVAVVEGQVGVFADFE